MSDLRFAITSHQAIIDTYKAANHNTSMAARAFDQDVVAHAHKLSVSPESIVARQGAMRCAEAHIGNTYTLRKVIDARTK